MHLSPQADSWNSVRAREAHEWLANTLRIRIGALSHRSTRSGIDEAVSFRVIKEHIRVLEEMLEKCAWHCSPARWFDIPPLSALPEQARRAGAEFLHLEWFVRNGVEEKCAAAAAVLAEFGKIFIQADNVPDEGDIETQPLIDCCVRLEAALHSLGEILV